jgi:hypothetical protein
MLNKLLIVIALLLQLYVIGVWVMLRRITDRRVWTYTFAGLLLITVYRLSRLSDDALIRGIFACAASGFFVWTVHVVRQHLLDQKKLADEIEAQRLAMPNNHSSLAHKLAEYMVETRAKDEYYRTLAKDHGLPSYEEFKQAAAVAPF